MTSNPPAPAPDPAVSVSPEPPAVKELVEADSFALSRVPKMIWRVLADPDGGIERTHVPGTGALRYGITMAILAVAVTTGVLATRDAAVAGKAIGGGVLFFGVGVGTSFLGRRFLGGHSHADWHDDAWLVGGALVFPFAAGALCLALTWIPGIGLVIGTIAQAGLILAVLSYEAGLRGFGGVVPRRAPWIAALVFGLSTIFGALLGFHPLAVR